MSFDCVWVWFNIFEWFCSFEQWNYWSVLQSNFILLLSKCTLLVTLNCFCIVFSMGEWVIEVWGAYQLLRTNYAIYLDKHRHIYYPSRNIWFHLCFLMRNTIELIWRRPNNHDRNYRFCDNIKHGKKLILNDIVSFLNLL